MATRRSEKVLQKLDLGPFQYTPKEVAIWHCLRGTDQPGFVVQMVDKIVGKGVFTVSSFEKGDFLLEYRGELVSYEEGVKRERNYPRSYGSFLYFFRFENKRLCMDATHNQCPGRYINDAIDRRRNAIPKVIICNNEPHICLFSTRYIKKGEEIRYDYGVYDLPWRKRFRKEIDESANNVEVSVMQSTVENSDFDHKGSNEHKKKRKLMNQTLI